MSLTFRPHRVPGFGYPSGWMRGVIIAAVASALLSSVGTPAAFALDWPARQPAEVDEADASSVGRPVAPLPEAAPPVPASPAGALDFVWLLPLGSGLAVLGVGWVLSRRNNHDDSD